MGTMKYALKTKLPGVVITFIPVYRDDRGEFIDTHGSFAWEGHVEPSEVKQVNVIRSKENVLRGAHVSMENQVKEVKVLSGVVDQILVDCRVDSPTFGHELIISHDPASYGYPNHLMSVFVPPHVANALVSKTEATILYTTNMEYKPEAELSVKVSAGHTLYVEMSDKDKNGIDVIKAGRLINEYSNR